MSAYLRPARVRALVAGTVALACGLALAACSSPPPATPTSTTVAPPHGPDKPIAELRSAYLVDTAPSAAAFSRFSSAFQSLGGQGTRQQITSIVDPAIAALKISVEKVFALRLETNTRVGRAIDNAVADDNTVYTGLLELRAGYGSRSFDLSSWGTAFAAAIKSANTSANVLRTDLGLRPLASGS